MIPDTEETKLLLSYVDRVKPERIKAMVLCALESAPAYFWKVSASITGKHHPLWANGEGGLVRHTIGAVEFGINLGRYDTEVEAVLDTEIIPALILHDITKYGIGDVPVSKQDDPSLFWFNNHHITAFDFLKELWWKNIPKKDAGYYEDLIRWDKICDHILTHVGRWGVKPTTKAGWLVHFADLAVATRISDICVTPASMVPKDKIG